MKKYTHQTLWRAIAALTALTLTAGPASGQRIYLSVDRDTGAMSAIPAGDFDVDGYTITSPGGYLDPDGWSSLADQNAAGWLEANPRPEQLSEFNWTGSDSVTTGTPIPLGTAYSSAGVLPSEEDLAFQFSTPEGTLGTGSIIYSGLPQVPSIVVNRQTGLVEVTNPLGFEIAGYTIISSSGALLPDGFAGLQDQSVSGWEEANPTATRLSELNLEESLMVDASSAFEIGSVFQPGGTEDLLFEYLTADQTIETGLVTYVGSPNDLTLQVDLITGEATIQNPSPVAGDFDIIGYSVFSESGSLSVDDWSTFGDSGAAGAGWITANPTPAAIAEVNATGVSALFESGSAISIGNIFTGAEDLVFEYGTTEGAAFGTVEYVLGMPDTGGGFDCDGDGVTGAGDLTCVSTIPERDEVLAALNTLPGDLDGDGTVAFADFLTLSGNFGVPTRTAYSDGDIGLEGDGPQFSDFLTLSGNFGQTVAGAASVPEPTGPLFPSVCCLLISFLRRKRGR